MSKPTWELAVEMIAGLGKLNPSGDRHGSVDPEFTQACRDFDPDRQTDTLLTLDEWRELARGKGSGYEAPFRRNIQDATDPFVFLVVLRDRLVHVAGCSDNIIRFINAVVDPHIEARSMTWRTDKEVLPDPPPKQEPDPARMSGPCLDLEKLYKLQEESENRAMDYLFREVDEALYAGHDAQDWPDIETLIEQVDIDRLTLTLMVGVLSITLPVKTKLKARPAFYEKVYQWVLDNDPDPERAHRLFKGLK